jgi:serine/threonine-protein kinase RsbW
MKELIVPGILSSLKDVRNYVAEAADQAGLDKKASYRLLLAIDELATNSIVHGYEETNLTGNLYLRATVDDKALTIFVEDTGNEYNPLDRETPDHLNNALEDRPIGGLGTYLALNGVDQFLYERVGDRNRNTLVVYRNHASSDKA